MSSCIALPCPGGGSAAGSVMSNFLLCSSQGCPQALMMVIWSQAGLALAARALCCCTLAWAGMNLWEVAQTYICLECTSWTHLQTHFPCRHLSWIGSLLSSQHKYACILGQEYPILHVLSGVGFLNFTAQSPMLDIAPPNDDAHVDNLACRDWLVI